MLRRWDGGGLVSHHRAGQMPACKPEPICRGQAEDGHGKPGTRPESRCGLRVASGWPPGAWLHLILYGSASVDPGHALDVFARLEGLEGGQAEGVPGRVGVDAAVVVWLEGVLRGTGS